MDIGNWLPNLFGSILPGLERALDYTKCSSLNLLTTLTALEQIRVAGGNEYASHMRERGAHRPGLAKIATTAVEADPAQTIVLPNKMSTVALVKRLAAKLLEMDRERSQWGRRITTVVRAPRQ